MTTLVIDANNILVRSMKATEGRVSLSSHGVPTAALLVFINTLSRYIREIEPDRVAACWDGGRSTYRLSIDPDYKAARSERTEEPDTGAFALAKEFLSLANIHHVERPGVEADDLIAGYWRMRSEVDPFFILSGDKDFLQLLDDNTFQIRPGGIHASPETERWDAARVREAMGCTPEQIPLVMALTGDSGDGVLGVPGFGTKTAVKALVAHEWSLGRLLMTADPKWAPKVAGRQDQVVKAKRLVDLREPGPDILLPPPPLFEPTYPDKTMFSALLHFLTKYELASVETRVINGTLWTKR